MTVEDVFIDDVKEGGDYKAKSPLDAPMKAAQYVEYDFIPSDDKYLQNQGFCVLDQFLGIYGPLIKKLDRAYFIDMCYKFMEVHKLDYGILDRDDTPTWGIEDGVTPRCLEQTVGMSTSPVMPST